MTRKLPALMVMVLFASLTLFAQIKFQVSTATGTYTALSGATAFNWASTGGDENYSNATPIGFAFTYNGVAYDSFQVSTNGYLRLGTGMVSATPANALEGVIRNMIAPLWDDITVDTTSNVTYKVEGAPGSQTLVVEWKAVKWQKTAAAANAEFQVRLDQASGAITFAYGTMGAVTAGSASIGISNAQTVSTAGQATKSYISLNIGGIASSRVYYASQGNEFPGIAAAPDNNTVITFTPITGSALAAGTYTVGGASPNYSSLSAAALDINARGIAGAVTIAIRPGVYDDVLHLANVEGTSAINTLTVKNESGTVTLKPLNGAETSAAPTANVGDAIVRLDGVQYTTIDGLTLINDSTANATNTTRFDMGLFVGNSAIGTTLVGSRFNTLKNLYIDMNGGAHTGSTGIRFGTQGGSSDTSVANSYNKIQDVIVLDFFRSGIRLFGFSATNPDRGNVITATGSNYVGDVRTATGSDVRAFEIDTQRDLLIERTDVTNLIATANTTNNVYGIWMNPGGTAQNSGNIVINDVSVFNLENQGTQVTSGISVGIFVSTLLDGSIVTVKNSDVYDIFSNGNGTSLTARGISFSGAVATANTKVVFNAFNNFVYDIRAPRSGITAVNNAAVRGIDINGGTGNTEANIYNNTISINDNAVTATNHRSTGIMWGNATAVTMDLRNNIVSNTTAASTGSIGFAVCVFATSSANLGRIAKTSDNNLYYFGTPAATRGVSNDAATTTTTLGAYQNALRSVGLGGPRELRSAVEMPPFVSATDLHLTASASTYAEGSGQVIATVTTDYDGNTRSNSNPDVGADEFTGVFVDNQAPAILFGSLGNIGTVTNRQVTVTVDDRSGLATSSDKPRLYYRKGLLGTFVADTMATNSGKDWTFTFDYSKVGGVVPTDTVYYYFAAKDASVAGNTGTYPTGGSGSPIGSTAPTTLFNYVITQVSLAGDYTIGLVLFNQATGKNLVPTVVKEKVLVPVSEKTFSTDELKLRDEVYSELTSAPVIKSTAKFEEMEVEKTVLFENGREYRGPLYTEYQSEDPKKPTAGIYATITAAATDLNARGVSGNTNFLLTDTLYTEATSVTITVGNANLPTSDKVVTIRPATGVNTVVQTNASSPVFLISSSYVTIDGSNVVGGTSRNMTIKNNGTTASSGVAFISGSTGNTIKNISGRSLFAVSYGIVVSGTTNATIENNELAKTNLPIQSQSNAVGTKILKNQIGGVDSVNNAGITVLNSTNFEIANNTIRGLRRATGGWVTAITIGTTGTSTVVDPSNGVIANNTIFDLFMTGTGAQAYGARGINISILGNNANITVANNRIYDLKCVGDDEIFYNPLGIQINQGGGIKIVNNSINLFGSIISSGGGGGTLNPLSAALYAPISNVYGNLIVENNIFANRINTDQAKGRSYAFYVGLPMSAFTSFNYNNLWVGGNSAKLGASYSGLVTTEYPTLDSLVATLSNNNYSINAMPAFVDSLNLAIDTMNTNSWLINGVGNPLTTTATDFNGNARSQTLATGPVDLGSTEFSPASGVLAPLAMPNAKPILGTSQVFTLAGKVVATIQWSNAGTVPDSVAVRTYNGSPATASGFVFGSTRWSVEGVGGSAYSYTLRMPYSPVTFSGINQLNLRAAANAGSGFVPVGSMVHPPLMLVDAVDMKIMQTYAIFDAFIASPTNLVVLAPDDLKVRLTWTDNATNENNYVIERKLGDSLSVNSFATVVTLPANATSYNDTSIVKGTLYTYRVAAKSEAFTSTFSNLAQVNTLVPVELTSFTAAIGADKKINLNWSTATEQNNRGFDVERNIDNQWVKVAFVEGNGTVNTPTAYSFADDLSFVAVKGIIKYRLKQIDFDGAFSYTNEIELDADLMPKEFTLYQNFPNPFNPTTSIQYEIGSRQFVQLKIYDVLGTEITTLVDEEKSAGSYEVEFLSTVISRQLASGVYFYQLKAGDYFHTKKMVFMK